AVSSVVSRPPCTAGAVPYTTLFRSRNDGIGRSVLIRIRLRPPPRYRVKPAQRSPETSSTSALSPSGSPNLRLVRSRSSRTSASRSEEHTSELQSRADLVCRLLLEKK